MLTRKILERGFDIGALNTEMIRAKPTYIPRGWELSHLKMETACVKPEANHDEADGDNEAHQGFADRPVAGTPDAHVAHGLEANGIEGCGEGGEIVQDEEILDQHAGNENGNAEDEDTDAVVEDDPSEHEGERQKGEAAEEEDRGQCLDGNAEEKAGDAVKVLIDFDFCFQVIVAHGLMAISRLRAEVLPHIVRSYGISSAIDGVRKSEWIAEGAVIVIAKP